MDQNAAGHATAEEESFSISDRTKALELPRDGQLVRLAGSIESAMRK